MSGPSGRVLATGSRIITGGSAVARGTGHPSDRSLTEVDLTGEVTEGLLEGPKRRCSVPASRD